MWTINSVLEKMLSRRHLIILSIPDFNSVLQWKVFLQLLIRALLISAVSLPSLIPVSSSLPGRIFLFSFRRKLTKYNFTCLFFSCLLPTCPLIPYHRHRNYMFLVLYPCFYLVTSVCLLMCFTPHCFFFLLKISLSFILGFSRS